MDHVIPFIESFTIRLYELRYVILLISIMFIMMYHYSYNQYVLSDHADLKDPKASDRGKGLQPPLKWDMAPVLAKKLTKWCKHRIGGRSRILVDPEHGVFVDNDDFLKFVELITKLVRDEEDEEVVKTRTHTPFQLSVQVLEMGVALLWPSQSCASLVCFRGLFSWRHGSFHLLRVKLLAGDYYNCE
jgi:hypothetical protein